MTGKKVMTTHPTPTYPGVGRAVLPQPRRFSYLVQWQQPQRSQHVGHITLIDGVALLVADLPKRVNVLLKSTDLSQKSE